MTAPVLLIYAHTDWRPGSLAPAIEAGRIRTMLQTDLRPGDIATAPGLIAPMHIDQIDFHDRRAEVSGLLAADGRVVFCGHILRLFHEGLSAYRPLSKPKRRDFDLTPLAPHPIFAGVDRAHMVEREGVAGFYGRGHNPLPAGASAITGLGPGLVPVDWDWPVPGGGRLFVHAGNDIWSVGDADENQRVGAQLVDWVTGDTP